mmetsp:Transcript_10533/g.31364  ORF Transcript_10533/g.31364 Transcript_10533/m.31364 type:complete len:217 (+) Transcript_10533:2066-2716(+)
MALLHHWRIAPRQGARAGCGRVREGRHVICFTERSKYVLLAYHVARVDEQRMLCAIHRDRRLPVEKAPRHRQHRHEGHHVIGLDEAFEVRSDVRAVPEEFEIAAREGVRVHATKGLKVPLLIAARRERSRADFGPEPDQAEILGVREVSHQRRLCPHGEALCELHREEGNGVAAHHVHAKAVLEAKIVHAHGCVAVEDVVLGTVRHVPVLPLVAAL